MQQVAENLSESIVKIFRKTLGSGFDLDQSEFVRHVLGVSDSLLI